MPGSKQVTLVDATSIVAKMKGVGKYAWQLCDSLTQSCPDHGQVILVVFQGNEHLVPTSSRVEVLAIPYATEFSLGMFKMPNLVKQSRATVFIRPSDKIGGQVPAKTLTVCHDLNPLIWEMQPPRKLHRKLMDSIWERLRVQAMQSSDLVVCNSEFVQLEVIRQFKIAKNRTAMGYCGVDSRIPNYARDAKRNSIPWIPEDDRYLLSFATGDEREGYDILPTLFSAAIEGGYTGKLAIAGTRDRPYRNVLEDAFRSRRLDSRVIWIPFLGADQVPELASLYRYADFYLETSRHEGFGMQLVEAMACGTTCFSSNRGALREVGGGFPLELTIESPNDAGRDIADAWMRGEHNRDNTEQLAFVDRYNWSETRKVVADFAWG